MKIAGLQNNSFVDYPGKIAAVVFTPGCNMNCFYCHNKILLTPEADKSLLNREEVLKFLHERRKFLDAVVISGGEPTLQDGLEEFMKDVKRMGYPVKLDTNGTNPSVLKKLINSKLLDYVAMDIKAPLEKYGYICGTRVEIDKIRESIDLLMQGDVDYEFRTTFVPQLGERDILSIAQMIKGARQYVLQQYKQQYMHYIQQEPPHSSRFIMTVAGKVKGMVGRCETRGCL